MSIHWYWHERAWGIHHGSTKRFDGSEYHQLVVNLGPLNMTLRWASKSEAN